MIQIRNWPRYHQDKHSEQLWGRLIQKSGQDSVNKILLSFDLVTCFWTPFHPWSNLNEILSRQTFWYSFMKIEAKLRLLEGEQGFNTIWPSDPIFFLSNMTHIQNLTKKLWRWLFWASLIRIGPKLWECLQGFSMICPTAIVSDPKWSKLETDQDIIKIHILSNSEEGWSKNLAKIV